MTEFMRSHPWLFFWLCVLALMVTSDVLTAWAKACIIRWGKP